jgi:hypothetical protein
MSVPSTQGAPLLPCRRKRGGRASTRRRALSPGRRCTGGYQSDCHAREERLHSRGRLGIIIRLRWLLETQQPRALATGRGDDRRLARTGPRRLAVIVRGRRRDGRLGLPARGDSSAPSASARSPALRLRPPSACGADVSRVVDICDNAACMVIAWCAERPKGSFRMVRVSTRTPSPNKLLSVG